MVQRQLSPTHPGTVGKAGTQTRTHTLKIFTVKNKHFKRINTSWFPWIWFPVESNLLDLSLEVPSLLVPPQKRHALRVGSTPWGWASGKSQEGGGLAYFSVGNRHHCGCMWLAQTKRGQVSLNKNLLWLKIKCPVLSCLQTLHNLVPAYLPRLTLRSASPCPPHSSPANSPFPTLPPPGCHGHHHLQWISLLSVKVKSYLILCLTELGPPWGSLPGLNKPLREGALSYAPSPPCASFWCPLHTAKYLTSLFPVNAPTTHFLRAGTECFLHHCSPRARHRAFRCVCWLQMNMCKAAWSLSIPQLKIIHFPYCLLH